MFEHCDPPDGFGGFDVEKVNADLTRHRGRFEGNQAKEETICTEELIDTGQTRKKVQFGERLCAAMKVWHLATPQQTKKSKQKPNVNRG